MESPETKKEHAEKLDVNELYEQALREHPEYKDLPEVQIRSLISNVATEIALLEEVGEKEKARIELPVDVARKIAAIWVLSGVGTYDIPLKPKEHGVYTRLSWIQWADRARLNHAATLARKVTEARSGLSYKGSLGTIKERKQKIKEMIGACGPVIIYNGTQLENDTVVDVLLREGTVIPAENVNILKGDIKTTLDQVKTYFKLPRELGEDEELAIIAHAPHLARVMRMVNKLRPFREGTKVRLFPVPTPEAGKVEYAKMEILGILRYVYLDKVAAPEPYPYSVDS